MKHSIQTKSIIEVCFFTLLYLTFLLPLIVYTGVWKPFEAPKAFFFLLFIELIFPFYIALIYQYRERRPSLKNGFLITFICFLIFQTLAAILGKDPYNSFFGNGERFDGLILWWHLPLFYLYLDYFFRTKLSGKKIILHLFIIGAGITALIGCLQAIHFIPSASLQFGNRISSLFGNPNFFAATLVIPFFLSLDRFRMTIKLKSGWFYGGLTLLCFFGVFVSQTRGAFLGLFIGGIVYVFSLLLRSAHKFKRIFILLFILLFVIGGAIFYLTRDHLPTESHIYRLTHFQDESSNTRLIYWDYALRGFKENPWLGVGHQNYYTIADKFYQLSAFPGQLEWPDKPHNMFLEILVTGGIFTFFAYLLLFVFATSSTWKHANKNNFLSAAALSAALVAYATQNFFAFDLPETLFSFIILMSFMNVYQNENTTKQTRQILHPLIFITVLIPIFGFTLFLYPFISQMHQVFKTEINIENNLSVATKTLVKASQAYIIYDPILLATEFEKLLRKSISSKDAPKELIEPIYQKAHLIYQQAIEQHPIRTFLLSESANTAYMFAVSTKSSVAQENIETAKFAHKLAPGRIEPLLTLMNILRLNKDQHSANQYALEALELQPKQAVYLWKLAIFYALSDNWEKASQLGLQALQTNINVVQNTNQIDWLIQYYTFKSKTNPETKKTLVYLYEQAVIFEPDNIPLTLKLMSVYVDNNQYQDMIDLSEKMKRNKPSSIPEIDIYIKSLRKK